MAAERVLSRAVARAGATMSAVPGTSRTMAARAVVASNTTSSTTGTARALSHHRTAPVPHSISNASGLAPRPMPSPLSDPRASKAAASPIPADIPPPQPATATGGASTSPPTTAATSTGKREEGFTEPLDSSAAFTEVVATPYSRPTHAYRCAVHVPKKYQRRDFADLFYGIEPSSATRMNVVTIALRANMDMASWSSDIREEREVLTKEFHTLASRAVDNLRAAGHWADYIDPSSGTAHHAAASRGQLVETDDRMATFGFKLLDFGCCKAITHPEWGTHVMVGVVFTDAPHEIVTRLAAIVTADSPALPTCVADATPTTNAPSANNVGTALK